MQDLKLIVVPVDLDQHTQKLVDYAIDMAKKLNCKIAFFHCVESVTSVAMGAMAMAQFTHEDYDSAHVKKAEEVLDGIIKKAADTCDTCRGKVVIGDPVDEILTYAEDQNADMIIIGTHGKSELTKILLGSVANRVLKQAHCPVLVMNPYR